MLLQDEADAYRATNRQKQKGQTRPPADSLKDPFVLSFFYTYTAAALGHPRARMQYSTFFLQNALLPSKAILQYAIDGSTADIRGEFGFLRYVSPDILVFLNDSQMTDVQFMKHIVQSQSTTQLYLASQ